jgi:NAD(P)-dependent dehydrogenase (short-subunit alcohol dehydrogenase family)
MASANQPNVWFITGTSQGFGRELVKTALDRGDRVVATSRDPAKVLAAFPNAGDRLKALAMDLNDQAAINAAVTAATTAFGTVDVLINNAGFGILGAVEEVNETETAKAFDINVHGLLRVTRAILPVMRERKSGHIVNLSSIGGLVGLPGFGLYNATKFAVEGLSEALAKEVAPLGIKVTIVEPGPFRTDFLGGSLALAEKVIPAYDKTSGQTRKYATDRNGSQPGDPVKAAALIVQAVLSEKPPLHLLLGGQAYKVAAQKLDALKADMETWRDAALATDFPS